MRNTDLSQPRCDVAAGVPLTNDNLQNGAVPIFWGDNQTLNPETLVYTYPSAMTPLATLHIPKVVRFLYTYDTGDDIDSDNIPNDPAHIVLWFKIITVTGDPGDVFVTWERVDRPWMTYTYSVTGVNPYTGNPYRTSDFDLGTEWTPDGKSWDGIPFQTPAYPRTIIPGLDF